MPYYIYRLIATDKILRTKYHYIGSTPKPHNRIRQHNGIITGGAKYTSSKLSSIKEPWTYNFLMLTSMTKIQALSLEWQLKHPFSLTGKRKKKSRFSSDINELLQQIDITLDYTIKKTHASTKLYVLMLDEFIKNKIVYKPVLYKLMYIKNLTESVVDKSRNLIHDMNELCYALNPTLQE